MGSKGVHIAGRIRERNPRRVAGRTALPPARSERVTFKPPAQPEVA